ncbi:MAG TPA: outer membrane beta-barrel protein [Hyphomicrobiaceae bacterium]|nr:outer membrane beta-barrel protein [Hyphomicrobiaceae bacterium]
MRVVLGLWITALVPGASAVRAFDVNPDPDRIDQTIAFRERLKDYDSIKLYGAERVSDRTRTAYQPDGIRVGNLLIFPSIATAMTYDDNIHASAGPRIADMRFDVTPSIRVRSSLPRHALDLSLGGRIVTYAENEELNHADFHVKAASAFHFDHAHTLSVSMVSELLHLDRLDPTSPVSGRLPVSTWHSRASVGFTRDVGRLYGTVAVSADLWDNQDRILSSGAILDQDARDQRIFEGQVRLGYRISPGFELLGRFRGIRYLTPGDGARDWDGAGYELAVGLAMETSPLLRWRLLGGYGIRDFDQRGMAAFQTGLIEGEVQWLPTELMTVTASVSRAMVQTLGDGAGDNGGRVDSAVIARIQYEVWRNLVLTVGGELRDYDYIGSDRNDRSASGRVGLEYLLNKQWKLSLGYEHQRRWSNLEEFNLTRNLFTFGAKLSF